ncbi:MAG TPA: lysylphosphatidylglycerol synthase transmembrane domain-containing protein, partial [Bryobacteraceae bacterium]|nr:lysylphosphatidylglycerol synthase transmembrane domain-containing protein [Bryobacteraceae bacterium]
MPAIGYGISAAALVWVYWGFEWRTELPKLAAADWRWVVFAMAADISTYFFQGWRWSLLLRPVAAAGILRSVQAIFVGLFANSILPLRTGEILRTLLQSRWVEIPVSVCLASVFIERLVDGILLVVCFYAVTHFVEVPGFLGDASLILAVVVGLLVVLLGIAIFHRHHAHAAVSRSRFKDALRHVVEGLHVMGNSPTFLPAVAVSLMYLASQVIPIYALGRGLDMDISLGAAAVVLVILRIGTVLPEAPSNVGVFQFFAVLGLQLFGMDKGDAAGF